MYNVTRLRWVKNAQTILQQWCQSLVGVALHSKKGSASLNYFDRLESASALIYPFLDNTYIPIYYSSYDSSCGPFLTYTATLWLIVLLRHRECHSAILDQAWKVGLQPDINTFGIVMGCGFPGHIWKWRKCLTSCVTDVISRTSVIRMNKP